MIRYAATASDGSRSRAETRIAIDQWAAQKCAEGCEVSVWVRAGARKSSGLPSKPPERVGKWIPMEER